MARTVTGIVPIPVNTLIEAVPVGTRPSQATPIITPPVQATPIPSEPEMTSPAAPVSENNGTAMKPAASVPHNPQGLPDSLGDSKPSARRGRMNKPRQTLIIGTLGEKIELSVGMQDLSRDEFIINAPRMQIEGKNIPALGGIPLLHKLGQGGMGAVYYGIHPGFRKEVAIKVLPFHLAQRNPDLINRFFREARIAANVRSKHLVHVTDVAQEAGISYLVMEYVTGMTAAHELKLNRVCGAIGLTERKALDICIGACEGLADAHNAGIIHRDVKPDNILIPKFAGDDRLDYKSAKLADLGLARKDDLHQSMTASQLCMGTPGYMAPEQIEDTHRCGKPADVFSMGATLYALLCGDSPFASDQPMKALRMTQTQQHEPVKDRRADISAATSKVADLCLAKDPTHRYEDGASLLKALKACRAALHDPQSVHFLDINKPILKREGDAPIDATQFTLTLKPTKLSRRYIYVAAAAVVVAIAGALWQIRPSRRPLETQGADGALPSAKDLDAGESDQDKKLIEKERVAQQHLEDMNKKLEETQKAKKVEEYKQRQAREEQRAEFDVAFAEAQNAAARKDWEQSRTLLETALAKPGAAFSAKGDEARAMEGAIRTELNRIAADKEYSKLMGELRKEIDAHKPDEFGLCSGVSAAARKDLEAKLVQARTLRPESDELKIMAEKLGRDAALKLSDGTKLELVLVPPGEFVMGYSKWSSGTGAEFEHAVKISKPFYMSRHLVTAAQFRRFAEAERYITDAEKGDSDFGKGALALKDGRREWLAAAQWRSPGFAQAETHPVVAVSWNDCQEFCKWLSRKNNRTFRLPTEAEWEYAARGPDGRQWPWGNVWIGGKANHADKALKGGGFQPTETGKYFSDDDDGFAFTSPANAYDNASWCGARDMAGNVMQWCQDWYSEKYYAVSPPSDPPGPQRGDIVAFNNDKLQLPCRVLRGGSFLDGEHMLRSSARQKMPQNYRGMEAGFRIVVGK